MTLRAGPQGSTIMDARTDPGSPDEALRALVVRAGGARAWAVLGPVARDDAAHDRLGRLVAQLGIYHIVAVGEGARVLFAAARSEGLRPEESVFVPTANAAITYLHDNLEPGAVILLLGDGLDGVVEAMTEGAPA